MRRKALVVVGCVVIAVFATAGLQSLAGGPDDKTLSPRQDGAPGDNPVPLPPAIIPTAPTGVDHSKPQLLGFTVMTHTPDRGVLNLTLACQLEFPGSRICAAEEIHNTMMVPEAPGVGYAWVLPRGVEAFDATTSCQGWTSSSFEEGAMTIALGQHDCYGGFVMRTCDQQLSIACCGMVAPPVE